MLEVLDSEKQSRRWVEAKIKSFDPETEYAEIVSLMAQYQLDEFTLNFLVTILTSYTLKPSHMAETLSITNKGLRRPNQRMQDTLDFFWIWHVHGPDSEETKQSLSRLNKLHAGVARMLPGHFENGDDFIYVLGRLFVLQDRLLKDLNMVGMDPHIKLALFNFARALSKHFRTEGNKPIKGFPNTPEALEAFVNDWESKNHGYSPVSRDIVNSFVHAFGDRWFPHPFKPLGRWVCIEALEDSFLEHVRIKPLNGIRKLLARGALKSLFFYKTRIAADRKISAYDERVLLSKKECARMDERAVKRVNKFGWTKGGRDSVGLGDGPSLAGKCPVMSPTQTSSEVKRPVSD